jgi:hypothetical protein
VPTGLVATATDNFTIALSWNAVDEATGYEVFRSFNNFGYIFDRGTTSTTLTDAVASGTTYVYKVRAVSSVGASGLSAPDLATSFILNPPDLHGLVVNQTDISGLRAAVDMVRAAAGLTGYGYADLTVQNGITTIKAVHITDLRFALDEARAIIGVPVLTYTDSAITPGIVIKAVHFMELRAGTR